MCFRTRQFGRSDIIRRSSDFIRRSSDFIRKSLIDSKNDNVFVFCQMGVSRSSTTVVAFLIREYQISLIDAIKSLREARDIIRPNFGFLRQLLDWEKKWTDHRSSMDQIEDFL